MDEPEDGPVQAATGSAAQSLYGNPAKDLILRFQRVSPMATSPHDPEILYYGSQHLHRTRDKGVTWETISPDLTAKPECCQGVSGEPITRDVTGEEFYSTLYAITESPLERGVIWTGANDGPFHVTRDNGKTWKNVTPKDLPPGGRVQWIEASPHRRGSAYFAVVPLSARRLRAVPLPHRRLRQDLDAADRRQERHPRRLADARRPRGSRSRGPALRRHRVRDVHLVRQRRALAAVPAEPAERADQRHQGAPEGSRHRDAGPRALDPRQPQRAASDHAADARRRSRSSSSRATATGRASARTCSGR